MKLALTKGVEAQVARLVVIQQLVEVLAAGGRPPVAHTVGLAQADGEDQGLPEDGALGLHLLEVANGRACSRYFCDAGFRLLGFMF